MKKGFEYLFLEFIKWGLEKKGGGVHEIYWM